jgi:hypothetical protein
VVDVVDHRRQRRGFAAAGHAADDDEAFVCGPGHVLVHIRQVQLLEAGDLGVDPPDGSVRAAAGMEDAAAIAVGGTLHVREVEAAFVLQPLPEVIRNDRIEQRQRPLLVQLGDLDLVQLRGDAQHRRGADLDVKVRGLDLLHLLKQLADIQTVGHGVLLPNQTGTS